MLNNLNRNVGRDPALLLLFLFGDGLQGTDLYLHAGAGGGFDDGPCAIAADEAYVDAAGGHHTVAFLQAVSVFFFFLGFLALRTYEKEVEHHYHQHNHDARFPAVGNVEEYEFSHFS